MRQRHRVATACGLFLSLAFASFGAEPPGPATGAVKLSSGRTASYAIHFDRNSIRASVRSGDHLIAATSSGALLRFDLPGPQFARERVDPEPITCLGTGEGGAIVAGYRDGRIVGVDPKTLDVRELFRVTDEPQWIGWTPAANGRKAGLIVATQRAGETMATRGKPRRGQVLHDLATGREIAVEDRATAFLIDRTRRIWLGSDHGEWGGRIARVDLVSGKAEVVQPPPEDPPPAGADREPPDADEPPSWDGIYGFLERPDGQVWAFGGMSHEGIDSGFIARVDGVQPRLIFDSGSFVGDRDFDHPDGPCRPITHIIDADGRLEVVSYDDIFRVDGGLKTWAKAGTLDLSYRWGRPDAMGAYPAVAAVHPPVHRGEPWILATLADGYVTLDGVKAIRHVLPGQLGASEVRGVEDTREGLLCFEPEDALPPWRLGPVGWEAAPLAPPIEVEPEADLGAMTPGGSRDWRETRVLVEPGGGIVTVSSTNVLGGTITTARRVGGKSERLGRERLRLDVSRCFTTPDGAIWNESYGTLRRFENGRWRSVIEGLKGVGYSPLRSVNKQGPPWLLLDRRRRCLWRLDHGPRAGDWRMVPVDLQENGNPLRVGAAIFGNHGPNSTILASDTGLRAYDPAGGMLAKVDLPDPPGPVLAMARDGLGRLWVVSKNGLRMFEQGSKVTETFERVPGMGRSEVTSLVADPRHEGGVVVGLGERGVAFVRVPPP